MDHIDNERGEGIMFLLLGQLFCSQLFSNSFVKPRTFLVKESICFEALDIGSPGDEDGLGIGSRNSAWTLLH